MSKENRTRRTLIDLLEHWVLKSLKINAKFLEAIFDLSPEDQETALESIYSLFETTRNILKNEGRKSEKFTKIAVIILNQVIRLFTTEWYKIASTEGFNNENVVKLRNSLEILQANLRNNTKLLSDLAGVEDLTELEVIK